MMKLNNTQLLVGAIVVLTIGCTLLECSLVSDETKAIEHQAQNVTKTRSVRFTPTDLFNFEKFKMNFNKHYKSIIEELFRRKLYLGRALQAFSSMIAYRFNLLSSYKSVNHMSDLTLEQLKQSFSYSRARKAKLRKFEVIAKKPSKQEKKNSKPVKLPNELFHDYRDCMNEPRDQGQCGACTMFSTIAYYEWMHCNSTGKSITFSEQFLLDCGSGGCGGGYSTELIDSINKFGFETGDVYPYFERKKRCLFAGQPNNNVGRIRIKNAKFRTIPRDQLATELNYGPVLIVILLDLDSFHAYGGGVDQAPDCDKNQLIIKKSMLDGYIKPKDVNIEQDYHAVVLVGDGREDGEDYWLIRNSHGIDWGEDGYYKLSKKATNRCIDEDDDSGVSAKPGSYKFYENPRYNKQIVDKMAPIWHDRLKKKLQSAS